MRVPPLYRSPAWQRFLAGVAIGALISWFVFLYMYGVLQEKQIKKIHDQESIIGNLTDKISIWEKEYKQLNERTEEKLTVQEVNVSILNGQAYKLDQLSIAEAEEVISDDLSSLIAKDLETVYQGKTLLKKSIENKVIDINKKRYSLRVAEIFFYTNIYIEIELKRL
jgi:hypothetical protein